MKIKILFILLALSSGILHAGSPEDDQSHYIEVTGSAEMEVAPDEVVLIIEMQEYWKEEFEKKREFEDCKTKVPISTIEKDLRSCLDSLGIPENDIILRDVGNSWRYFGKELLINKQIQLRLSDMDKINEILMRIDTRGVSSMRIAELKNKKLTEYRKQVKVEALKAAKEKADYLLGSIDRETGDVIFVEEKENAGNNNPWFIQERNLLSNVSMNSPNDGGIEELRTIKLRYEVKARFEIR